MAAGLVITASLEAGGSEVTALGMTEEFPEEEEKNSNVKNDYNKQLLSFLLRV